MAVAGAQPAAEQTAEPRMLTVTITKGGAGFGLGLERAVQLITGMTNIRDVIPFPRTPGHAEF